MMQTGPVDPGVLGARLRQQQRLDDPIIGATEPLEAEARSALWPHARQWALIELTHVCENGARRLEELRFTPAPGAQGLPAFQGPGLPVAILFERSPNGASRARIYSAHALAAHRAPPLPPDEGLRLHLDAGDVLARCMAALQAADPDATLELFETDGYLQETDGAIRRGAASLRGAFERLYRRGAPGLRCCSRLDDGPVSALEIQFAEGRPALAVCQRAGSGRLAAVRLYC